MSPQPAAMPGCYRTDEVIRGSVCEPRSWVCAATN